MTDVNSTTANHEARALDGLGSRVASRREALGLTVTDVARAIGVSASLISQIERGRSQPSIATLFRLSRALAIPVDYFFGDGGAEPAPDSAHGGVRDTSRDENQTAEVSARSATPPREPPVVESVAQARDYVRTHWSAERGGQGYVVHPGERVRLEIRGDVRWERLTPASLGWMDFIELVYGPHSQSDPKLYRHPGIEMLVVTQGVFRVQVGFDAYELREGDSMMFPSSIPHRVENPTDRESHAIYANIRDESLARNREPRWGPLIASPPPGTE